MRHSAAFIAVFTLSASFIGAAPLPGGSVALAQSKQDIVRSLSRSQTRSLKATPPERKQKVQSLVRSLRGRTTRQISLEERQQLAKIVEEAELPAIDLEVYFAFDSAAITEQALPKLTTLGQALNDAQLKGQTFMIAGHTDAKGRDAYNQKLSERRADSVKQFLIRSYGIDPANLIAVGYGEEQLKNQAEPHAGENRRVQIVNLTEAGGTPPSQTAQ